MSKEEMKFLRKGAFSVAFGLAMGKFVAEVIVQPIISGVIIGCCDNVLKKFDKKDISEEKDGEETSDKVTEFHKE